MPAQSGLGFSGIVAIQIPDDGAPGTVLTKLTADNYDYDWLAGGGGASTIIVEDEGVAVGVPADTLDFVGAGVIASGAGTTKTITIPGGSSSLQAAYDFATAPPQIVVNGTPDPVTIDASVAGDVFAVTDVAGGDLVRISTTGSQITGGVNAGNFLTLQGSSAADRGQIQINGGTLIDFDWSSDVGAYAFRWANTIPSTGGGVFGMLQTANVLTIDSGVFISSTVDDNSNLRWTVSPGFAVQTLFFARPTYRSTTAAVAPSQAFIYVAQAQYQLTGTGAVTVGAYRALSFTPIIRVDNAGDDLSITNTNGLTIGPAFNTRNATAVADYGNIRGVHMLNASTILFGQSLGSEIAANWIGLDVNALTGLVVSGVRAAVRSAIPAGASNFVIQNNGGAESDFGLGDIHLNDSTFLKLGNTVAAPDILLGYDPGQDGFVFSSFFGVGGNPLYLQPTAVDEWIFKQNSSGTQDISMQFDVTHIAFGEGAAIVGTANFFVQFQGPDLRGPNSAGFYSDVLWTAGGQIDIDGLAMTEVNSFRIDPNITLLNGGSVQDQSGLFLAGMGFPGSGAATRLQSLRVTGRSRMDGLMNYNEASLAQLTADATVTLPITNSGRFVILQDADANGPWTIEGVVNDQPGDAFYFINDGANGYFLGHEDVGAAAADRIITPTGVDLLIGPDEMAKLWYDPVATRWRVLETTGA